MNLSINHWANKFAGIITLLSLTSALCVSAATTATITVSTVGGGTVTPTFSGPQTVGNQYTLTAKPKAGFIFNGWTGSYVSSQAKLSFVLSSDVALTANFLDTQSPTISIMPVLKSWSTNIVSNAVYVVTGKAKDNGMIAQVYCKVNNGPWLPASTGNNWNNWWANMTLSPNTNTVLAYAVDSDNNVSKTATLKIVYTAAQPALYDLIDPKQATMVVTDTNFLEVEQATFSSTKFTDLTGVGTYTYKRTGPITGKLMMKYTAPPSAVNATNNVNVTMLYDIYYSGTFEENPELSFSLYNTPYWAPIALTGSKVVFTDNDGVSQTKLSFPQQPSLGANEDLHNAPNPVVLNLSSDYPGQIGDRVKVTFDHKRKANGRIKTLSTPIDTGTVVATNSSAVKILFDSPSYTKSEDMFAPVALNSISYYYQDFLNGNPVTNGTGTFTYTNYTWVGSLLKLNQNGQDKYMILTFTNDIDGGIYYDETHLPNSTMTTTYGSFELTLPPQIIVQPQDFAVTNGGNTANFSVVANGTPLLVYQWQFNGTNITDGPTGTGSTLSGSTTTNLSITGLSLSDFGNYRVVVSNDFGVVTSRNALLGSAVPPVITTQPLDFATLSGATASFSVSATGSQPLGYKWQFNGVNVSNGTTLWGSQIQGATTYNLALSSVATNDSGFYQVIITNNFGSVTSSIANLIVIP